MRWKKAVVMSFLIIPQFGITQSFYRMHHSRNIAVSGGLGSSGYFGELKKSAPGDIFKLAAENRESFGMVTGVEYFFLPRFSVRSELSVFRLSETDKSAPDDTRKRNQDFRSTNIELSTVGTINLLRLPHRFDNRYTINIHLFAGIGIFTLGPRTTLNGKTYALRQYRTEGQSEKYSWIGTAFPFGGGIRVKTSVTTSLVVEAGYRYTNTDYIDDASGVPDPDEPTKGRYPTADQLGNDPIRIALSDRRQELIPGTPVLGNGVRGNPTTNDGYFLFNIKLEYYLPHYLGERDKTEHKLRNMRIRK